LPNRATGGGLVLPWPGWQGGLRCFSWRREFLNSKPLKRSCGGARRDPGGIWESCEGDPVAAWPSGREGVRSLGSDWPWRVTALPAPGGAEVRMTSRRQVHFAAAGPRNGSERLFVRFGGPARPCWIQTLSVWRALQSTAPALGPIKPLIAPSRQPRVNVRVLLPARDRAAPFRATLRV